MSDNRRETLVDKLVDGMVQMNIGNHDDGAYSPS